MVGADLLHSRHGSNRHSSTVAYSYYYRCYRMHVTHCAGPVTYAGGTSVFDADLSSTSPPIHELCEPLPPFPEHVCMYMVYSSWTSSTYSLPLLISVCVCMLCAVREEDVLSTVTDVLLWNDWNSFLWQMAQCKTWEAVNGKTLVWRQCSGVIHTVQVAKRTV